MSKPIILYGHGPTPNPVKVAIVLEELGVPYEVKEAADAKAEPFISLNPNGRLPAIEDPNTGFALFEVPTFWVPSTETAVLTERCSLAPSSST